MVQDFSKKLNKHLGGIREHLYVEIGEKKYHGYFLTEFNAINKRHNGYSTKFIKIFNKLYKKFPTEIKPPQAVAKVVFAGTFELNFEFILREKKSLTGIYPE